MKVTIGKKKFKVRENAKGFYVVKGKSHKKSYLKRHFGRMPSLLEMEGPYPSA